MRISASVLKHFFSKVPQDVSRAPSIPLDFASDVVLSVSIVRWKSKDPALEEDVLDNLLQLLFILSERRKISRVLQDYGLASRQDCLFVLLWEILKITANWQ
jgi:hypothetical protein